MRSLAIIISVLLVLFSLHQAQARIIHIPAEQSTIQGGINVAMQGGDTVLVAPGTYYEHVNFYGKGVVVKSDKGRDSTTITKLVDGISIVSFVSGEGSNSVLDGFTITGGNLDIGVGAGIRCLYSSPKILNNRIINNTSLLGAGIDCSDNSSPLIANNLIEQNAATSQGGGIRCTNNSSPVILENVITGNSAAEDGGGILCLDCWGPQITVTGNKIIGNTAQTGYGGGIGLSNSWANITDNTINGNSAGNTAPTGYGGGIAVFGYVDITNNTIDGNSAWRGGGIFFDSTSGGMVLNTIVTNSPAGRGIRVEGPYPLIIYCDVWNNLNGNYNGCLPGEGSISADPLFCNPANDNYYLYDASPCVAAGEGGGDMGAFGIGCSWNWGVEVTSGTDGQGPAYTQVPLSFYVQNTAGVLDSLSIDLHNSLGWSVDPTYLEIVLDSHQRDTIVVNVWIPNVPLETKDRITLKASSLTQPSACDSASLSVTCDAYSVQVVHISDVGDDQGKQVRIDWSSFPGNDSLVTHFTIFRRIDSLLFASLEVKAEIFSSKDYPPGSWEMVETYPAYGGTLYSVVVPTLKDSTIARGMYWSAFFIRAGTNNPIVYFDSPVDSGYSLDNLSPSPPTELYASHAPASTKLIWHAMPILDFDYHTVYRDTLPGFTPSLSNRVGFTIDTTFTDSTAQLGRSYHYFVTATDFSGNESAPSNEAMGVRYITGDANTNGSIDLGDLVYLITYLYKNGPAPRPLLAGDVNCDGAVALGDVVYLITYQYKNGPPPPC